MLMPHSLRSWCVLLPSGGPPRMALRVMHAFTRFGNLEVFLMAFIFYIAQEGRLLTMDLKPGLFCLIAYSAVLPCSLVCTTMAVRACEARELSIGKDC